MLHTDELKITPLGAGNEVGRSCIHISYRTLSILLDCGVHPAYTGISSLPFLDLIDLSTVDAVFITHFHLDHAGALPFLTEKTGFRGRVYMTHPTKAILRWLLNDYIRIINANADIDFYTEEDLARCYDRIIAVDYRQTVSIKNLRVTPLNAGHVLGAAMFLIETDRVRLLYTGDYSTEEDRHLKGADTEWINNLQTFQDDNHLIDLLICESTYGVQCHLPRVEREKRFTQLVHDIVTRGGKCLLPVFALGRAQELLLILEDFWSKNPKMHRIPILYASALASRCLSVYQAYAHMLNSSIKKDAFTFKYVQNLRSIDTKFNNGCVVMASPGMLQSGHSRELFEQWCEDPRNGTIIAGYCVQGTLAKEILNEPKEIVSQNGQKLKLNSRVEYISFSAHVDFPQNLSFIRKVKPKLTMLVHGESNEMMRLKSSLENEFSIITKKNGESHSITIRRESSVVGRNLHNGTIKGIVVSELSGTSVYKENDLNMRIMQEIRIKEIQCDKNKKDHKSDYTKDSINSNTKQLLLYNITPSLIKSILIDHFPSLILNNDTITISSIKIIISKYVTIIYPSSYINDMLILTIIRLLQNITNTVKINKISKKKAIVKLLRNYYKINENVNDVEVIDDDKKVYITENGIRGDCELVENVKKLIKKVVSIF